MKKFNIKRFKEIKKQVEEEITTLSLPSLKKLSNELESMRKPYYNDNEILNFITGFLLIVVTLLFISLNISLNNTLNNHSMLIFSNICLTIGGIGGIHLVAYGFINRRRKKEFRNFIEEDCKNLIQCLKEKYKSAEETLLHEMEEKILSSTNEESGNIQSTIKEWRANHIKENS